MNHMKKIFLPLLFIFFSVQIFAQLSPRTIEDFDNDWKFFLGDDSTAKNLNYNDASWRNLNLPHDWSIEGKFDSLAPAGVDGGALPGGVGWYRKTFTVPSSSK